MVIGDFGSMFVKQICFDLLVRKLVRPRPGVLGWIARKSGWNYGWLPVNKSEEDALIKLAREWNLIDV